MIVAMISDPLCRVFHYALPTNLFSEKVGKNLLEKLRCIIRRKWSTRSRRNDLGFCTATRKRSLDNVGDIFFVEDMAGVYGTSVTRHSNKIGLSEEIFFLEETLELRRGSADANAIGSGIADEDLAGFWSALNASVSI